MKSTVTIPGMSCGSCAALVKEVSGDMPSVQSTEVDMKSKKVSIEHGEDFNLDAWIKEIEALGGEYKVTK